MHIPDGYLSPSTSALMYVISTPFIIKASKAVKKNLKQKTIPLVSIFSALSFVIMLFNIPLPGGTTGHAVGATIASIVLGPWSAILAVSIALVIQAVFFGDGGILTLGANIFNMAVVMSLTGYMIYKIFNPFVKQLKFKMITAAIAGYVAINAAALLTAIELGIQPILFHDPSGKSLYFPFGLNVSIPAMMLGHLTLAGFAEAFITGLSLRWIYKLRPDLLIKTAPVKADETKWIKFGWISIFVLAILSPLGLLAPGTAWGEWNRFELAKLGLNYLPLGVDRWSEFWRAPLSGYNFPGNLSPAITYIMSGLFGIFSILIFGIFIFWILSKLGGQNGKS